MNRQQRRDAAKRKAKRPMMSLEQMQRVKAEATDKAVDTVFSLMMAIPIKVVCEKYEWSQDDIDMFANDLADEYARFQQSKQSIYDLQNYVFDKCGLKFEYREE